MPWIQPYQPPVERHSRQPRGAIRRRYGQSRSRRPMLPALLEKLIEGRYALTLQDGSQLRIRAVPVDLARGRVSRC